jgi:hypothetical protein
VLRSCRPNRPWYEVALSAHAMRVAVQGWRKVCGGGWLRKVDLS